MLFQSTWLIRKVPSVRSQIRRYSAVTEPNEAHSSRRSPVMAAWPAASLRVASGADGGGVLGAAGGGVLGAAGAAGVVGVAGVVPVGDWAGGAGATLARRVFVPLAVEMRMAG